MAELLSKEQVAEFKAAFDRFAKNKDGTIDVQELGAMLQLLGRNLSEAELKALIAQVDTDGDGVISFEEFLAAMAKRTRGSQGELWKAFHAFDLDGDGRIGVDELRQAVTKLGGRLSQEELDSMLREADLDQDGQVNYEEFVRILTQK
uniref:Calmodulin like 5 n=1 Tax=Catagonus wagneri TaxID=51154 RepID=A0A8C3YP56_9CETA